MFERKKKPGNRAAIADALFNMSVEIVTQRETTFEKNMSLSVLPYADAAGFDRLSVYRLTDTGVDTRFEQLYSWDREYGGTSKVKDTLNGVPLGRSTERWQKTFQNDRYINARRKDMPHAEQDILGPFSVHGIMIVPIFIQTKFWGVLTYQEHTHDRAFDESASDVLVSGAHFLADVIMKEEIIRTSKDELLRLRQNKRMADALSEATVIFLSQTDKTAAETVNASLRPIAEALNIDRITIWRNFQASDGLHVSQIYRWDKDVGGIAGATKGLDDIAYHKFIPLWESKLKKGQVINGPAFEMPESEQLRSYGCMSIFVAPLIFNTSFWGFALFEDKHIKRNFDKLSGDTMRQAGLFVANSIIRSEMERDIAESGEFNRALFDAPLCFALFDDRFNAVDCNNRTLQLFECDKQFFCANFYSLSPDTQPDGTPSAGKITEYIKACLCGERISYEWTHINNVGEIFNVETTLTRIKYRDRYLALAFFRDLRNVIKVDRVPDDNVALRKALDDSRKKIAELQELNKHLNEELESALSALQPTKKQEFFSIDAIEPLELSPAEFTFSEMIENSVSLIENQLNAKRIVLTVDIEKDVPACFIGDSGKLSQIIASLLSKISMDADKDAHISLHIILKRDMHGLCLILIEITGVYHTLNQESVDTESRIIELMGGKMTIDSDEGKISFTIKVRRVDDF